MIQNKPFLVAGTPPPKIINQKLINQKLSKISEKWLRARWRGRILKLINRNLTVASHVGNAPQTNPGLETYQPETYQPETYQPEFCRHLTGEPGPENLSTGNLSTRNLSTRNLSTRIVKLTLSRPARAQKPINKKPINKNPQTDLINILVGSHAPKTYEQETYYHYCYRNLLRTRNLQNLII